VTEVLPPASTDGPQEPVDWRELQEASHPTIPSEALEAGDDAPTREADDDGPSS
jgi:hypothetical protein